MKKMSSTKLRLYNTFFLKCSDQIELQTVYMEAETD
jgi:hypothetical protein